MISKKVLAFFIFCLIPAIDSHAYWVWSPESGKFVNPEEAGQDSAHEQYEYAMKLYNEKDLDKAVDQLKDLLKKYKQSKIAPEAQYRLGVIYEEKSDYDRAFEAYKTIIESYPQSDRIEEVIERQFRIGNLFLSGRKGKLMGLEILPALPRAAEAFEHIVKHAPYSAFGDESQFRLGLTYKRMGRFDEAASAFQAVIDNYPQSELVSEARFQVAENAFQRSNVEKRDQRALEKASEAVDHFLERYPESTATEKASKLREEIDEKNAEKNFRTGSYYEKTNYLSSAIIYYKDVAKRYPETKWGVKAKEKLEALEQPVAYLGDQEEKLQSEIELGRAELEMVDKKDKVEREAIERRLDRLKQRQKSLEKNKEESLHAREEDLKRRESELKEKVKKLDKKKELLKVNQSEDFKRAIDKWQASLDAEKEELARERQQLRDWKEQLGMSQEGFLSILPFVGEPPTALEEVRQIEAKKLYKVSDEKKDVLEEKELLYKQYHEVSELLGRFRTDRDGVAEDKAEFKDILEREVKNLGEREKTLEQTEEEIKQLQKEIERKNEAYKEQFGENLWKSVFVDMPADMMNFSAGAINKSVDFLNPFDTRPGSSEEDSLQELSELRMHLKEKIAAQQELVDTLSRAFDEELALQEQRRLIESLEGAQETDGRQIRKDVKAVEKEIRAAYEDIGDRHEKVEKLTDELETVLKAHDREQGTISRIGNTVTAPLRMAAGGAKDFLFGRRSKDAKLTETAESLPADGELSRKAKDLREAIQLESLMIESRNKEIYNLRKELDILKTHASLAGGYKFRSSIVSVPYGFLEEALDSAKSLVPNKDQKDVLISRLDSETKELEESRKQLEEVERRIAAEDTSVQPSQEPAAEPADTALSAEQSAEEQVMREDIRELVQKLENSKKEYAAKKQMLKTEKAAVRLEAEQAKDSRDWDDKVKNLSDREKRLQEELDDLSKELRGLIEKEKELEKKESEILEKRINKIDQMVQNVSSKAAAQDLLTEKSRLEDRLSQLELRKDFLAKEIERF